MTVPQTIQDSPASSPARLIEMAIQQNADVAKLEKLMDLQERWDARQAEVAFNAALNKVQANLPQIEKKADNKQTSSKYAKLEHVNAALVPVYAAEGFSISWGTGDSPIDGHVRLIADLSHSAGHTRRYHLDVPLDRAGVKGNDNKTLVHATGSSISYGRRYLTLMMFNASTYDDQDGNHPVPRVSEEQQANLQALIDEVGANKKAFLGFLKVTSLADIRADRYVDAVKLLEAKRKAGSKGTPA